MRREPLDRRRVLDAHRKRLDVRAEEHRQVVVGDDELAE